MKRYIVQITDKALADMEEIYDYIAMRLQAPENAKIIGYRMSYCIKGMRFKI